MLGHRLTAPAAETLTKVVAGIDPGQLIAPTPCTEYDVQGLINHLLFWGPSLEAAASKRNQPPPSPSDIDLDLTTGDWSATLTNQLTATANAWSAPTAWQGVTPLGGQNSPAPLIGGMVLTEFVVHGWDLARATNQHPTWPDDLLAFVQQEVENHAPVGRELGMYGSEVPTAPNAPVIDRIVAITGRNPAWPGQG